MSANIRFWQLTDDLTSIENKKGKDIPDDFRPKMKFNYTIKFAFGSNAPSHQGSDSMESVAFGVKQVTRPNIIISHADINFYNYRTKVTTRTDYGQYNISFYDDHNNTAHDIFTKYLNAISPISNRGKEQARNLRTAQGNDSVGALDNEYGIIKYMTLTHHSVEKNTIYDYLNPKITSVMLDELDMTTSDSPTVSLTFAYDSVNITSIKNPKFN